MAWLVLFVAGLFETAWALALKESEGLSKLGASLVFVVCLIVSMLLLAWSLRELPIGTGYAVWTGTGAVGAAIAGMVFLGEPAAMGHVSAIGLIAVGIVWLALSD